MKEVPRLTAEQRAQFLPILTVLKAAVEAASGGPYDAFYFEFHGEGDSGEYEPPTFTRTLEDGQQHHSDEITKEQLSGIDPYDIQNFFMEFVSWDWYNNDGGQGTCTLDLKDGSFIIEGTQNETVHREMDTVERRLGVK
jgi:hypothetical protein